MEPKNNSPEALRTRYEAMLKTEGYNHMVALIQGKTDGIDDAEKQIAELQAQVEIWRAQRAAMVKVITPVSKGRRRR